MENKQNLEKLINSSKKIKSMRNIVDSNESEKIIRTHSITKLYDIRFKNSFFSLKYIYFLSFVLICAVGLYLCFNRNTGEQEKITIIGKNNEDKKLKVLHDSLRDKGIDITSNIIQKTVATNDKIIENKSKVDSPLHQGSKVYDFKFNKETVTSNFPENADFINLDKIPGVKTIELNSIELDKLGIRLTDAGVIFHTAKDIWDIDDRFRNVLSNASYPFSDESVTLYEEKQITSRTIQKSKLIVYHNSLNDDITLLPIVWTADNHLLNFEISKAMQTGDSLLRRYYEDTRKEDSIYKSIQSEFDLSKRRVLTIQLLSVRAELKRMESPLLKKLVMIKINLNSGLESSSISKSLKNSSNSNIKLWFLPDEYFLSKLPNDIANDIRQELVVLDSIENGNVKIQDACKKLYNEASYFDFCRESSGTITSISAYPNPAVERTILKFKMFKSDLVSISIHNLDGKLIKLIGNNLKCIEGFNEFPIDLTPFEAGFYLLAVTNSHGEQVLQRIIIQ